MNPDPFAPVDVDTPFRFDHLLHFLTNLGLCVAVIVGVTGAALIYWRLRSPGTYEEQFANPARLLRWRLWAHLMATVVQALRLCPLGTNHASRQGRPAGDLHALASPKVVGNRRIPYHFAPDSAGKDGPDGRGLGACCSSDSRRCWRTLRAVGGRRARDASDRAGHARTAVDRGSRGAADRSGNNTGQARPT